MLSNNLVRVHLLRLLTLQLLLVRSMARTRVGQLVGGLMLIVNYLVRWLLVQLLLLLMVQVEVTRLAV